LIGYTVVVAQDAAAFRNRLNQTWLDLFSKKKFNFLFVSSSIG
jgi:hypothetical protein